MYETLKPLPSRRLATDAEIEEYGLDNENIWLTPTVETTKIPPVPVCNHVSYDTYWNMQHLIDILQFVKLKKLLKQARK